MIPKDSRIISLWYYGYVKITSDENKILRISKERKILWFSIRIDRKTKMRVQSSNEHYYYNFIHWTCGCLVMLFYWKLGQRNLGKRHWCMSYLAWGIEGYNRLRQLYKSQVYYCKYFCLASLYFSQENDTNLNKYVVWRFVCIISIKVKGHVKVH